MIKLSKGKLNPYDLASLLHGILSAYQKTLSKIGIGEGPGAITEEAITIVESLIGQISPKLVEAGNTEEALKKLTDQLMASEVVQIANITKDGRNYVLDIDGCVFAKNLHPALKPIDITCPWAIIAMAVTQRASNRKVMINPSHYNPLGTTTLIAFL